MTAGVHPAGACAAHPEVAAGFQCDGCGALLCEECIVLGTHLIMCGLCGERVFPLPGAPVPAPSTPSAGPAEDRRRAAVGALAHLTNHVAVPGAIIAMVTALLFFLVDLRSIFLPYGPALKWLGFWYVIATVLIARYGKLSRHRARQGCYTAMLGAAMALVLILQPWERRPTELADVAVNGAIVLAVWLYATRLTASLSREAEEAPPGRQRPQFYGVDRLEVEAWERTQHDARLAVKRRLREAARTAPGRAAAADAHGNPSAAVARLAAGVLLLFALAEPLVMAGPPEVGERALAATVVFLLASAVLLAAGSAVGTLRHARRLGGEASESLVPARVAAGGFLMAVLLALALAVPGVAYRGSGALEPERAAARDADAPSSERGEARAREPQPEAGEGGQRQRPSTAGGEAAASTATALLNLLTALGRLLWIPFVLALIVGAVVVLARLAPFLAKMRLTGWRGALARLAAALARWRAPRRRRRGKKRSAAALDLGDLSTLAPRAAVVAGYTRLLAAFGDRGYPRPERQTPYEFLAALPAHLRHLREPLESLTALYVRAAYGAEELAEGDRRQAVSALAEIKRQLPSPVL